MFSIVVLLFAGVIYAWSFLSAPFKVGFPPELLFNAEFGWDKGALSLNYTLSIVFFCIGGFLSGLLSKKTSPRFRCLVSTALLFTGFFITSRLDGSSIVPLYLAYGIMSGLGIGFVYATVIGLTAAWFPDKPGLCSGLMLMGFGSTSLIVGSVATSLFHMESFGWRNTYLMLAIIMGVVFVAAAFILRPPREGTVFPHRRVKKSAAAAPVAVAQDYTARKMARRPSFWKLFTVMTLIAATGSAAISNATDILQEIKLDWSTAAMILLMFNGLGRLALGAVFDAFSIRRVQYFVSIIALLAPLVVIAGLLTQSIPLGVAGLSLCCFSYGFAPTMSSVFSMKFYGPKNFARNFSILNLILIPAPFAALLAGSLFEASGGVANGGSFLMPFVILTCAAALGFVLNLTVKKA
ncbi:MAG: MFS transporter [Oscillospiraceae bacterium]|nr:MFS transporter [Oscillospiraceae bacterium]